MYLAQPNSMWCVFKKVGGLDFLLKCDFEVSKIPQTDFVSLENDIHPKLYTALFYFVE